MEKMKLKHNRWQMKRLLNNKIMEMETHLKHLNLIAQTQGEKEKKDLTVIPIMKKMMKAPVNKLTLESGIEVTIEKQLLVILMLV